jgi:uncharacterized protein (DUF952 family)
VRLFHLITESDWALAQQLGQWKPPSLEAQGFVHLSEREQVEGTARRFYAGRNDMVLLEIETALLPHPVRYEEGEPGILFPHLYGPLPLFAIVSARPLVK